MVSWNDAEAYCRNLGAEHGYKASLASIHSEEENDYINDVLRGHYFPNEIGWIGLIKNGTAH
jgi:hypothetical protein